MRWLLIGLLVSVAALLLVAAAGARHIWRQRRPQAGPSVGPDAAKDAGKSGEDV